MEHPAETNFDAIGPIIQVVTTPLALAALAVIILGAVYQLRSQGRQGNKQVFWLILCFGLLGTGTYIAQLFWFSEAVFKGDVRDNASSPIPFAVVDIPGVGTTATNQNGLFQIPVPYTLQRKDYKFIVRVAGYDPNTVDVPGPKPDFTPIVMTPKQVKISDYVDIKDYISVSQNVGDPLLLYSFRVKDQFTGRLRLTDLQIILDDPNGLRKTYYPVMLQRNGFVTPFTGRYVIDEDEAQSDIVLMFSPDGNRLFTKLQELQRDFGSSWLDGCMMGHGLGQEVLGSLQEYFDSVFFWSSGKFAMSIVFRVNDQMQDLKYQFSLSERDVSALKAIRNRLQRCAGMMAFPNQLPSLSYTDPIASNFVTARIN